MSPLVLAGLILLFGSFIQGTIGFALGMVAVPLLVSSGYSLSQAVALTTVAIGIQVVFGSWQLRQHIPWQDVKLAVIVRYLTVPIGVAILLSFENMDTEQVKRLVGVAILIALAIRAIPRQKEQRDLPLPVTIGTFSISGVLQGIVAMGGPPVVLWVTTRPYTAQQARAFILTLFMANAPVQITLLLIFSDNMNLTTIATALLLSPLIFIGTRIGVQVGNRFSKTLLNRLAMAVLLVIALNSIF